MRHFINFLPPAGFFGVFLYTGDFYTATATLVGTIICAPLLLKLCSLDIRAVEWATVVLVVLFGGISLLLRDAFYLQIKTTVINWLFAVILLTADYGFRKNLARGLLGSFYTASDSDWRRVSCALAGVFVFIGALNIAIMLNLSQESWVWIKTFVYPGVSFVGVIGIFIYLAIKGTPLTEDQ